MPLLLVPFPGVTIHASALFPLALVNALPLLQNVVDRQGSYCI